MGTDRSGPSAGGGRFYPARFVGPGCQHLQPSDAGFPIPNVGCRYDRPESLKSALIGADVEPCLLATGPLRSVRACASGPLCAWSA